MVCLRCVRVCGWVRDEQPSDGCFYLLDLGLLPNVVLHAYNRLRFVLHSLKKNPKNKREENKQANSDCYSWRIQSAAQPLPQRARFVTLSKWRAMKNLHPLTEYCYYLMHRHDHHNFFFLLLLCNRKCAAIHSSGERLTAFFIRFSTGWKQKCRSWTEWFALLRPPSRVVISVLLFR